MLDALRGLIRCARRRVSSKYRQTLGFAAVGTVTERLTQAPQWLAAAMNQGWDQYGATFARETAVCALSALVVSFAFRLCTERGDDLVRRPWKFGLLLLAGATVATALWWWGKLMLGVGQPGTIVPFWLQTLLWGGLIGWLYLLTLQRAEDQAAFAALMARHALLARRLARSRLGVARAQVDPGMVAAVLGEVHWRYADRPDCAAALLDQLIAYLRLAMHRGPGASMAMASDIDVRAAALADVVAKSTKTGEYL